MSQVYSTLTVNGGTAMGRTHEATQSIVVRSWEAAATREGLVEGGSRLSWHTQGARYPLRATLSYPHTSVTWGISVWGRRILVEVSSVRLSIISLVRSVPRARIPSLSMCFIRGNLTSSFRSVVAEVFQKTYTWPTSIIHRLFPDIWGHSPLEQYQLPRSHLVVSYVEESLLLPPIYSF